MKKNKAIVELVRIVVVVLIALAIGFVITAIVSEEPVAAYTAFLTGPLPRISFENGFSITNINRFGNWMEESTTLILLGLAVSLVFRARQFSLGAEGQMLLGALATAIIAVNAPLPRTLAFDPGAGGGGHGRFSLGLDPRSAQGVPGRR
jgi:ABC-type uncharacterized transport system permease subunit